MNGVRCYSGYILPSDYTDAGQDRAGAAEEAEGATERAAERAAEGAEKIEGRGIPEGTLIVSIMTNNCTSPTWKVRPLLDRLMVAIANCN